MREKMEQFLENIHQQFNEYYENFLQIADRAPALFLSGDVEGRLQDDLLRVQLYRLAIGKSVTFAQKNVEDLYNYENWENLREKFKHFNNELATTYFTSVMRKVFAQRGASIEFDDDGIAHVQQEPVKIVSHLPIKKRTWLGKTIRSALKASLFSNSFSDTLDQDIDIMVAIINENIDKSEPLTSLDLLLTPFFRGKGAYLVGQLNSNSKPVPLVFSCMHSSHGLKIDAVLIGYQITRSFLFSSTRSAFTVSTRNYQELYNFLQNLFPVENPAYILDIIGFTHPAKISLLKQLRKLLESGEKCRYLGKGPVDCVFGLRGFPMVFKVIRGGLSDRQNIIQNFIKVHTIDRLGQILDSLDYHNIRIAREHFSDKLLATLVEENPEDITIGPDHIHFKRLYAARRIIPVIERIGSIRQEDARHVLLMVGWNIKHLAAMGFLPKSLGLDHFGLTSWGRVVYLDNASLKDIRLFTFDNQRTNSTGKEHHVDPSTFEQELQIPEEHKDIFRAIHGDLFSTTFWRDIQEKVNSGQFPDFFPYPSRFRLDSRKFRYSVFEELKRMDHQAEAKQIHMALDSLAVVDVELAGLSFLRLEVRQPSARVLVIEPIGPEIIAQLHHRFKDVTFDILQSESEVVESAGHWTPGIHGKLNTLVQVRPYDYVIGYVNETFDEDFFRLARLKGFLLLSTGTHNIDVAAATRHHTVVTNAPGPTTTTVAEQNIGLILDAIYSQIVRYDDPAGGFEKVLTTQILQESPLAIAQVFWLSFLQKTLQLDAMFSFGASELYVRTGVGKRATVYHDQIGQNREANILKCIGIVGLDAIGIHIMELCIVHEVSTLYVLDSEYAALPEETRERIHDLLAIKQEICKADEITITLKPVSFSELFTLSEYTFITEATKGYDTLPLQEGKKINMFLEKLSHRGLPEHYRSFCNGLTLGIQGLGRIGEAVAQRAISLGMSILIFQRDPQRPKYQTKLARLKKLASHMKQWTNHSVQVEYAKNKEEFFRHSNIITTLAATTENTKSWVDHQGLEHFASRTSSPVRVIVSAGKGLVDEEALLQFLSNNPDAEARLDVLVGEHEGGSYRKLVGESGQPLTNIKVTGHTAAAVREVRQLKIFKALDNLRRLIDGRIPPNIINNPLIKGKAAGNQSVVEIESLRFFRMNIPAPRARVLIIEPLPPEIVLHLQQQFGDVAFDILLAESELIKEDGHWTPGINSRLNKIVANHDYDYCLGYCNANFDAAFFSKAQLKGLMLFSTATHHIDLQMASQVGTMVTNSPGYTTVAVTEQNIGMALDALYGQYVQEHYSEKAIALIHIDITETRRAQTVAHLMWFSLLRRALRLDAMYEFGSGNKYVRTGVRHDATVYHDQLGQYSPAGIMSTIGIIGLDEVGLCLVELAMAFELSTIFILKEEYQNLSKQQKLRLEELSLLLPEVSSTEPFSLQLKIVNREELLERATYTITTPVACKNETLKKIKTRSTINVLADELYINDFSIFNRSIIGLNFGVQGFGRIGEAVVQRALALGATVMICQRNPERKKYQEKRERLQRLARNRTKYYQTPLEISYVDKKGLFTGSNIVTTLAATTSQTKHWVDQQALEMLGEKAQKPVRILVNAGKGLLNEEDLAPFLREHPDVEVRLDVLTDEQEGKANMRFLDTVGRPLSNLRIAGHTAAAVPELRRLKIFNALQNLRLHIDGQKPSNILNPESS